MTERLYSVGIKAVDGLTYNYDHIAATDDNHARQLGIRRHVNSGNPPGWVVRVSAPLTTTN